MSRDPFCRPPGAAQRGGLEAPWDPERVIAEATRCLTTQTCTWCEVCQLICPDLCITRDPDSDGILIDLNHCKGCGLCAHFCPKGAIRMETEPAG